MMVSTVFKSGNSAAVRLRKELGLQPGTLVEITADGEGIRLRPLRDRIDVGSFAGQLPNFPPGDRRDLELKAMDWHGRMLPK